jgi:hypothetical protein
MTIHDHVVRYQEHSSTKSYEELVDEFEQAVGDAESGEVARIFIEADNSKNSRAIWESDISVFFGPSGFLRVFSLDLGTMLSWYGKQAKAKTWIYGNPIIADTLLRYDIRGGGWLPLQILIYEADDGEARLAYDLPSSVLARFGNEDVDAAAKVLDAKIESFAKRLTGSDA